MRSRLVGVAAVGLVLVLMAGAGRAEIKLAAATHVGVMTRVFHPKDPRNWRGDPEKDLRCTVWYPAVESAVEVRQVVGLPDVALFEAGTASPEAELAPSLQGWPLVLVSHGTGGSAMQMAWLGTALARAGFVVVAVDHPGSNSNATLTPEGMALWWERATDLSQVLDGMLADPVFGKRIDATRVGAAGFSLGGYTVLELAGAQTDISTFFALCGDKPGAGLVTPGAGKQNVDAAVCHLPEMHGMGSTEDVLRVVQKSSAISLARSSDLFSDGRIGAVFAIAPALGFTMTEDSLHAIRMPVEMVVGDDDRMAPAKDNAEYIRQAVRGARLTTLPNVDHYAFLDTCTAAGKMWIGQYCGDGNGADRDAVHAKVAAMAVTFFDGALKVK